MAINNDITIPYGFSPRPYQVKILSALDRGCKNAVWVVHRRGGKDVTMFNYTIKRAFEEPGIYYYMLPTYSQAKKVIWDGMTNDGRKMLHYVPPQILKAKPNNTEMKLWISTKTGGESLIQLIGSDNYDNIMGTNPRGVVFSEWSLMDPTAYDYIKPILAANDGWCCFIYTPRGKNHGWALWENARKMENWYTELLTVNDTGVLSLEKIEEERRKGMPEDMIQQEFFCNFNRGQEGSYYGRHMEDARKQGRICSVPFDPAVPVNTYFDLGVGDSTAIWFAQYVGKEIHLINYYENSGEGLPHYVAYLDAFRRETGCIYDAHVAPHDIVARELSTGKSRLEAARRLGISFQVAEKLSLESGIESVRSILSRCWFDEEKCKRGIECLESYRKAYNEKFKVYSDKPFHDWASHGADAFRMLAITEGRNNSASVSDEDYMTQWHRYGPIA